MPQIADLLASLPKSKEIRMTAAGHALWVSWHEELDPAVPQTLLNYGGMSIASDRNQSLWFFFTMDIFLALARLSIWARFNSINASIVHLPAKLLLGVKREIGLDMDANLARQEILNGEGLDLWIHPKTHDGEISIPGITFEPVSGKQGLVMARWSTLTADPRLPYTSTQGWYAILRPLGNPLDRNFQSGWGFMYEILEKVLQQNKFKYILHDNFVMVSVDNLRLLRTWLRDMLSAYTAVRHEQNERYWPCVSVIIDRKGLNFSNDLPKKVGLQWDNLMPDFPYMSYRNAYLLGEGFAIQDIRFSDTQSSMDSWCNVALDEGGVSHRAVSLLMAGQLTSDNGNGCFYCGIRSHESHQCPTIRMPVENDDIWWKVANLNLDAINECFRNIEHILTEKGLEGYQDILAAPGPTSLIMRAVLDINRPAQLRMAPRYWLTRGRDFGKNQDDAPPPTRRDESPAWEQWERVVSAESQDLPNLEKNLQNLAEYNPRESRLRTLLGFVKLNKNDPARALASFKEAASLTTQPLLQAWNEFLHARLMEIQGRLTEAIEQYEQILRIAPAWNYLEYRQIVCKVKLGFAEQALPHLHELIQNAPEYFNRCLLDPELGRGQLPILTSLYPVWEEAAQAVQSEKTCIQRLTQQIATWFPSGHPASLHLNNSLNELRRLSEVNNYVAFLQVLKRRPLLEKNVNDSIQQEIEELQERFKHYLTALQHIRDEASWFPFPKVLREFSREFNECAGVINWAFASNFQEADAFQRAQASTAQVDQMLRNLKSRLKFLRMVRDSTLYLLILGKTFFWIEIVGLLLCFLGIPVIVFYGDKINLGWLKTILATQQWEVQKVLLGIITLIAMGIAALHTTIVFEKKRDKLIEKARSQREHLQQTRLERIKRQREAEAAALARERKREEERERRLRMMQGNN